MPSGSRSKLPGKEGAPTPGPLFTFDDGCYLTHDRFVRAVREALMATGVDAIRYAGHSFRIGAATTAANCGIQDSLIRAMDWMEGEFSVHAVNPH